MAEQMGMNEEENALSAEPVSLCDAIDRVLDKGAVLHAELTISVADVDLIYINLAALIASVDTARGMNRPIAKVIA